MIDGERIAIQAGENVIDSHDVVRLYPDHFRALPRGGHRPMKVATRSIPIRYEGQDDEIVAGYSRVADDHPLVAEHPDAWRDFTVDDELRIRSEWIAEMNDRATRVSHEPLSRAGREERKQEEFWRSVDRMVNRDDRSPEERSEQAFFDTALAQLEESDARELAEVNAEAVRDYGFDREGWSRRIAG